MTECQCSIQVVLAGIWQMERVLDFKFLALPPFCLRLPSWYNRIATARIGTLEYGPSFSEHAV